jgi:hypothetical protein
VATISSIASKGVKQAYSRADRFGYDGQTLTRRFFTATFGRKTD